MNQKHRTLLRMNDEGCPSIFVEVTATDFDGVRMIFNEYKLGDAPILLVNCLEKQPILYNHCRQMRRKGNIWIDANRIVSHPYFHLKMCERKSHQHITPSSLLDFRHQLRIICSNI